MSLRNSGDSGSEAERENIPGRKNSKSKATTLSKQRSKPMNE